MAKGTFVYTLDSGNKVKVVLDVAAAAIGGFEAPTATDIGPVIPGFGKRMRGCYFEGPSGSNYFLPMATQDEVAYATDASTTVTYKGTILKSISRRGEKYFYGSAVAEGETDLATP